MPVSLHHFVIDAHDLPGLNPGPDTSGAERDAEIERLIALGARPVDVGQRGDETRRVLADPEGNEFYVVRPKRTLTS
jgi:Glyoxalase-like domain